MQLATLQTRPLLVIIGPSGCGKSTIVRELVARGALRIHPTWTTRSPRADEDPNDERLEHRFVDEAEFAALETQGFFMGTTQMFGLPHRYGLPHLELDPAGPLDAVMMRAPLVAQLRAVVPWLLVYQIDGDLEQAAQRIADRSVDDGEIRARSQANEVEMEEGRRIADRVFSNDRDVDELVDSMLIALFRDVGLSLDPEISPGAAPVTARSQGLLGPPSAVAAVPPQRRKRSVGEKIALVFGVIAVVLAAGTVIAILLFVWALSQWGNNK